MQEKNPNKRRDKIKMIIMDKKEIEEIKKRIRLAVREDIEGLTPRQRDELREKLRKYKKENSAENVFRRKMKKNKYWGVNF